MSIAPLAGPLGIVSLQLFLGVTLKTVYLSQNTKLFSTAPWLERSNDSFEIALIFICLFTILICVGYCLAGQNESNRMLLKSRKELNLTPILLDKKTAFISTIIVVSISLLSSFLYLQQRALLGYSLFDLILNANVSKVSGIEGIKDANFGSTFAFITQFFFITQIYLLIFYSNLLSGKKNLIIKVGFGISLFISFFQITITGKRNDLIFLIFSMIVLTFILIIKTLSKNMKNIKQKSKYTRTFILMIAASILIFGFISYVRGNGGESISLSSLLTGENLLSPILESTYFTDINMLASIMEKMGQKNLDFLSGKSYLSFFHGLIPRFIWPSKPAITLGIFVKNDIFGLTGTLGGFPPTMPGEAYINFGWMGLAVGAIYGFFLRKFEFFVLKGKPAKNGIGLYLYSLLVFPATWSIMQSSFAISLTGLLSFFLLIHIIYSVTCRLLKQNEAKII